MAGRRAGALEGRCGGLGNGHSRSSGRRAWLAVGALGAGSRLCRRECPGEGLDALEVKVSHAGTWFGRKEEEAALPRCGLGPVTGQLQGAWCTPKGAAATTSRRSWSAAFDGDSLISGYRRCRQAFTYNAAMCGRYRLDKTPGFIELAGTLQVSPDEFRFNEDCRPAAPISIIVEPEGKRSVKDAVWHLYLEQTDKGLKPHKKYFSINTRFDKLQKKYEYKSCRCIILATAFVESKESNAPYLLSPADGRALAFGGLYKTWTDQTTGEIVHSASMITVPGHPAPAMQSIHDKAFPLWLPYDSNIMNRWLNCEVKETAEFDSLLKPKLHTDLKAIPIDKASKKNPIGEPIIIPADQHFIEGRSDQRVV